MKELKVKYLSDSIDKNSIEKVSDFLDTFDRQKLDYVPWPKFPGKPKVDFAIAHDLTTIFLKYYVEEKYLRAENNIVNGPVHEDSCVEFFVSFDEGDNYYNIEFNCIGIGFIAYGNSKANRVLLDTDLVSNLKTKSIIAPENDNVASWQLTLAIPMSTFIYTPAKELKDMSCRVNFYKCGDMLPEPHFISWSNIIAGTPNFHLPEFFGRLVIE
ncbi:MAG: carbohydrate-binding family 9-like protein [Ferruginibacter sp.]